MNTGPRRRSSFSRIFAGSLLATCCLLLSSCVYLRLLEFKQQLGDFDRYFTLKTEDGLRLTCLTPVLLTEDFRWLGLTPETVKTLGQSERWRIRWVKQLRPRAKESDAHDIELQLVFTDGKFTHLFLPERYFAFVPKPFFTGLLRSLGKAGVDKRRRLAEINFTPEERALLTTRVVATSLAMLLGTPSEQTVENTDTLLRYRYAPVPPESKNGVIDMTFTFDNATGQLQRLNGRSPVGQIAFNFEKPPATVPASPNP